MACFVGSVVFIVLFATNALLAPYLQTLGNYPVETAGLLMAPRGLGTMLAMFVAGRLVSRMDARLLMAAGLLAVASSMWEMTGWTPDVSQFQIGTNAIIQGVGIGLVFTPLTLVAFATLPADLRTDGTAFFNLIRNIAGAVGISATESLLTRNVQIVHSQLAAHVDPFNRMLQAHGAFEFWNAASPTTLARLNLEITRQATIVGYIDDFKLMMLLCLPAMLLLFFLRKASSGVGGSPAEVSKSNGT